MNLKPYKTYGGKGDNVLKKRIIGLTASLLMIASLASCGQDIAKEATQKGQNYFDSGDYTNAAKAFGLAIDNGSTDEKVKLLYDMSLAYHQAEEAFSEKRFKTAKEIIGTINPEYANYGIKESILSLENDVDQHLKSEELLTEISQKLLAQDYSGANVLIDSIDVSILSPEQVNILKEYKLTIEQTQAPAPEVPTPTPAPAEPVQTPVEKPAPTPAPAPVKPAINIHIAWDQYIFPSDTTLLTREQLNTLTKNEIQYISNEIYARRGHIFTTEKWQNYFGGKTWYRATRTVTWSDFNEIEKANLTLMKEYLR